MSVVLRILLIAVSFSTVAFISNRLRKSKIQIEYSAFWFLFSLLLLFISLFPGMTAWLAEKLGVISPVNLIFLSVIFVLLLYQFNITIKVAKCENKLRELVQELAIQSNLKQEQENKNDEN